MALGGLLLLVGRSASQVRGNDAGQFAVGRIAQAVPTPAWTFIGPLPMLGQQANFGGPLGSGYAATGRVTSIAFDPNSHDIFVGTANGGLWVSSGGSFQPLTLPLPPPASLSKTAPKPPPQSVETIGAIVINPATTPSTVYVATGEANNSRDSYYGYGIFKSTDLGATWTSLQAGFFRNAAFTKMALHPGPTPTSTPAVSMPIIYAAAGLGFSSSRADAVSQVTDSQRTSGLFKSTDGGTTWLHFGASAFKVGSATCTIGGDGPCPAADVAIDQANQAHVYAAITGADVFRSTDDGGTWTSASFPGVGQIGRASVAVGPPSTGAPLACTCDSMGACTTTCGTVYAMLGVPDGNEYAGFFKSTDGGATWGARTVPSFTNPTSHVTIDGTSSGNFSQSSYDQTLFADPIDATGSTVFFGGVGLYKSTNSGATWSFLAAAGGTHADQHTLAFDSGDTFYLGNDGGAFSFSRSGTAGGIASFTSLNGTISAGQIQSIAPDPTNSNKVLAGFQDNGVQNAVGQAWTVVDAASGLSLDGGFTLIDHTTPNLAYHTFSTTAAGPILSRSADEGLTWDSTNPTNSIRSLMLSSRDAGANVYPPLANDPNVAGRVLFGAHFIYASTDGMLTWQRQEGTDLTGGCATGDCALQDIEIARSDATRAWALSIHSGGAPFRVFNTTQANLNTGAVWTDVTSHLPRVNPNGTQATGIAIDPNHATTAYLSLAGSRAATGVGHVYRTTDFGASWAMIDGAFGTATSIPDVPVLRVLADRVDLTGGTLYAGTDTGVYRSTDSGITWSPFNQGTLQASPVFDIQQNDSNTIFIGTHGRGAYTMPAPVPAPAALTITPTTVSFGNELVFNNNGQPSGQPSAPRVVNVLNPLNSLQDRPVLMTAAPQLTGNASDFLILSNTCTANLLLKPNAGCSVKLQFKPTATNLRTATLSFFDTATNSPQNVTLTGNGVQGTARLSPVLLNFARQKVTTTSLPQTATFTNNNPITMGIQGISIGGSNPADFHIASTTCGASFPASLVANHSCSVKVTFTPTVLGPRSAALLFTDDAVGSPQQVQLKGSGGP